MSAVVYVLFCLALPWVWGAILAAVYRRRDRRRAAAAADPPPPDYSI